VCSLNSYSASAYDGRSSTRQHNQKRGKCLIRSAFSRILARFGARFPALLSTAVIRWSSDHPRRTSVFRFGPNEPRPCRNESASDKVTGVALKYGATSRFENDGTAPRLYGEGSPYGIARMPYSAKFSHRGGRRHVLVATDGSGMRWPSLHLASLAPSSAGGSRTLSAREGGR